MQRKSLIRAGTAIAVLSLVATACGKSSTSGGGSNSGTKTVAVSSYNSTLAAIVNPSDKAGGDLKLQASGDFDSLDPARTYYAYSWDFQRIWQRTVMAFKPATGVAGTGVVPDLATAPGIATNGGKTWTYNLRSGIKFEDGTPMTSKDIKYAVERVFAEDVISGGPIYLVNLLGGAASYPGPYKDKDPNHLGLTTVLTPTDTQIVFNLTKPFSDFDYLMAIPGSTPVPQKIDLAAKTGGTHYASHPYSVGPYMISSYVPNQSLKFVRNPNWSKSTDPLRKALPDTISLTEGLDPVVMDNNLFTGTYDLTIDGFGLQQASVAKVFGSADLKKQADNAPGAAIRYISIQEKVAPFDGPNGVHCRRAVQYAADKVSLQFARGGPVAGGQIAHNMVVPSLPSYEASYDPYPSGPDNKGDLVAAKKELALCGHPNGFDVNLATTNKGKGPLIGTALQQGLARVGIKVNVEAVDSATYYSGFIGSPTNVHNKKLGLAVAGWGPDFPTEYGFWESIIDGNAIVQQGNSNYAELNDPAINDDIKQALATTDAAKKQTIWKDVSHKVMDSADLLPFVTDISLGYHPPRVTNIYFNQAFGLYDYMNLGVVS